MNPIINTIGTRGKIETKEEVHIDFTNKDVETLLHTDPTNIPIHKRLINDFGLTKKSRTSTIRQPKKRGKYSRRQYRNR